MPSPKRHNDDKDAREPAPTPEPTPSAISSAATTRSLAGTVAPSSKPAAPATDASPNAKTHVHANASTNAAGSPVLASKTDLRLQSAALRRASLESSRQLDQDLGTAIADFRMDRASTLHAVSVEDKRLVAHESLEDVERTRARHSVLEAADGEKRKSIADRLAGTSLSDPALADASPSSVSPKAKGLTLHDSKHTLSLTDTSYESALTSRLEAVSARRDSISLLKHQEVELDLEIAALRQELAELRRRENMDDRRKVAHHLSVEDVDSAQTRKELADAIETSARKAGFHRTELKTELANAMRADRLLGIKEKQKELRHEAA